MTCIGIISDTHNLLRPEAIAALEGSDLIVHAGDIGGTEIISRLQEIAPVRAVRGNIDPSSGENAFPLNEIFEISGKSFCVIHNLDELELDPAAAGFDILISGHSHIPKLESKNRVLFLNPGSAGPRRFKLPISLATLQIENDEIIPELIELKI
ncbi:MAG: metallophosphoesterase family protein [SAR324 cluster bacterium]|nr:metallophosphoesterase family protein [SAR324 cluster bacterium]